MNNGNSLCDFLACWEGNHPKAYYDPAGLLTIGIGHLLTQDELSSGKIQIGQAAVDWRKGLSKDQIYALCKQDTQAARRAVLRLCKGIDLTSNQIEALTSFVFNVGQGAFARSTLLKKIQEQDWDAVPRQWRRWVYSAGQRLSGLVERRRVEIELWRS